MVEPTMVFVKPRVAKSFQIQSKFNSGSSGHDTEELSGNQKNFFSCQITSRLKQRSWENLWLKSSPKELKNKVQVWMRRSDLRWLNLTISNPKSSSNKAREKIIPNPSDQAVIQNYNCGKFPTLAQRKARHRSKVTIFNKKTILQFRITQICLYRKVIKITNY